MQIRLTLSLLFAASIALACHRAPAATPGPLPEQHFSVVLEHSATGWAAHCEFGCHWTDLAFQCASCKWRLDADGVRNYDIDGRSKGFAFVLSAEPNGFVAQGLQGVRWVNLSWNCDRAVCRRRLDETGVQGA